MGAPTRYESTDASAPIMSGQAGAAIGVLSACLVDGYGAKAAAGWTKPYTGTNLAVFRNSIVGTQRYLRVDDTVAQETRLRAYASMSAVSTGTGAAPADPLYQRFFKSDAASSAARPWTLIADDRSCILFVTNCAVPAATKYPAPVYFGDLEPLASADTHHFCVFAEHSTISTSLLTAPQTGLTSLASQIQSAAAASSSTRGFVVGSYGNVEGPIGLFAASLAPATAGTISGNSASAIGAVVPALGGPIAGRILVSDGSAGPRGFIRGVLGTCNAVPKVDRAVFSDLSGYSGDILPITSSTAAISSGQYFIQLGEWD